MHPIPLQLILASTSPYRRELLGRLGLPFSICSPAVDETRLAGETPYDLVRRLSEAKARAGAAQLENNSTALIIGSDQVAVLEDNSILGKPGTQERACAQLACLSGQSVKFLTGLCLYNSGEQRVQLDVVPYQVRFRTLTATQIQSYVQREQPLNCAGSFKSEGLGIALFERMEGQDSTALIGLPLIRLVAMLAQEGVEVLST